MWTFDDLRDIVSATDLARETSALLRAAETGRRLVIVNKNSPQAALIGMDDLRLLDTLRGDVSPQYSRADTDAASAYLTALGIDDPTTWDPSQTWEEPGEDGLRIPIGRSPSTGAIGNAVLRWHGLAIGDTGAGKTVALRIIVLGLCARYSPKDVQLILVGGRDLEQPFHTLNELPHVLASFDKVDETYEQANEFIMDELQRRRRVRDADGVETQFPHLVVMADLPAYESSHNLPRYVNPHSLLFEALGRVCRIGRELNTHAMVAVQKPIPQPATLHNISYSIALRTNSANASREAIGTDAAYRLPGVPGAAIHVFLPEGRSQRIDIFNPYAPYPPGQRTSTLCDVLAERIAVAWRSGSQPTHQ